MGLDHYEVRGWRCVHRHFYVTQLSHLFCARVRQEYDATASDEGDRLSVEQVRSAMNVWLDSADLPPKCTRARFKKEQAKQQYYQQRSKQARESHAKTRRGRLARWESTPTGSNRASTARTTNDPRHVRDTTYGKRRRQSGAAQLASRTLSRENSRRKSRMS